MSEGARADLLSVAHVRKRFDGFVVLDDVSIGLPARGLTGVVGTNGAGKSTLFAIIGGQIQPDEGEIRFDGKPITALAAQRRASLGIGRTFQVPREFMSLSVRENLLVAARRDYGETLRSVFAGSRRVAQEEAQLGARADEWLAFLNLAQVAAQPAALLSGGQKKLLELGRMLMLEPRCILLDEPFAGVNPVLIGEISERIGTLNAERGIAFLIIEHNLRALKALARHLYVMDQGRVIAQGDPDVVLADPRVHEAYMGGVA